MRLPDSVSVARRWLLAGGAVALLLLLVLVLLEIRARPPADGGGDSPASLTPVSPPVAPDGRDASSGPRDVPAPTPDPAAGVPIALRIPALEVDAGVDPVPLDADGLLVPPADVTRVGWWSGGALPGSRQGAALLAGHSVRLGDGVFDDLDDLEPGDRVRVVTARGEVSYRVHDVLDLSKQELADVSAQLFSQSGVARLVLVTCADWVAGDYHGNTVVVAGR